jgi:hypothetical protein
MTDFPALLRGLAEAGVEFIVVGGAAAAAHGAAGLADDLDIVYRRSRENVDRLVLALSAHEPRLRGAPPGLPFEWSARTIRGCLNFALTTRLGDLDLLGETTGGGGYEELLARSVILQVFKVECRCLGLLPLIQLKRATGRPRDLELAAKLEAILRERDKA